MIKLKAIKTKDNGYYIAHDSSDYYPTDLKKFLVDGKNPEKTFNGRWFRVNDFPKTLEEPLGRNVINCRYEIKNDADISEDCPKVLTFEEAHRGDFIDTDPIWKDKYAKYRGLYTQMHDFEEQKYKSVEFEVRVILEIDEIKEYAGFSYPIQKTQWLMDGFMNLTQNDISHDVLDTILFPDIVLPARTSKLTSEQTYKIIRKHVQDNINSKYACISSDYDFCFAVCKKIELVEPKAYQTNINALTKRKPKYVTRYHKTRSVQVFEMTNDKDNYKGYTPIKGFEGKNIEDLKNKIDEFLENLMERINEPLVDCKCCNGLGVVYEQIKYDDIAK